MGAAAFLSDPFLGQPVWAWLAFVAIVVTLLSKHGAPISPNPGSLVYELINAVRGLGDRQVMDVLAEVVATAGDLRSRVNPKYRFDERMHARAN